MPAARPTNLPVLGLFAALGGAVLLSSDDGDTRKVLGGASSLTMVVGGASALIAQPTR